MRLAKQLEPKWLRDRPPLFRCLGVCVGVPVPLWAYPCVCMWVCSLSYVVFYMYVCMHMDADAYACSFTCFCDACEYAHIQTYACSWTCVP